MVDRWSLARGPGGRSVIVELDPARLRGTAGPERARPGRKYMVTGVAPDAVRALVIGTKPALARFAADPGAAARFDFGRAVKTERGWRVERREPVTVAERWEETAAPAGHGAFQFKRDVLKRTTFTVGDTLDQAGETIRRRIAPRSLDDPSWVAIAAPFDPLSYHTAEGLAYAATESNPPLYYVEAQYHGPLGVNDIADILFLRDPPSEILKLLLQDQGLDYAE